MNEIVLYAKIVVLSYKVTFFVAFQTLNDLIMKRKSFP